MAASKKRRKVIIFSIIGLVVAGLTLAAVFRKREVFITVQTEKVSRHNLMETVKANGRVQPVVKVNISPEVSGEIIELPLKEGQPVHKGDLILKIKPDFYQAAANQAEAAYQSSLAGKATAEANLRRTEAEFKRNDDLSKQKLVSDSTYDQAKADYEVAKAQLSSAEHQVEMSRASLDSAKDSLSKTTIVSPLTGTVSKLNSEVGERVVGTATMAGTEVMTIADLDAMEARVDIGEMDIVEIAPGQCAHLEVDAFKDRKFTGIVSEIANSSRTANSLDNTSQDATKFQVRIRINEKEAFRPGMSVTAEIETRSRTNVLAVPIPCVTARPPKSKDTNATATANARTNTPARSTNTTAVATPARTNHDTASLAADPPAAEGTNAAATGKKVKDEPKAIEVVFVLEGDQAKMVPVKRGISDDNFWEITEGLKEGQEVITGGYKAISQELEDGKKVRKGTISPELDKDKAAKK